MEFLPLSAFSLEKIYATHTLVACLRILLCEVSQEYRRGISRYLEISEKNGIDYA